MAWGMLVDFAIVIFGTLLAAPFLYAGLRLLGADPAEHDDARRTSGTFRNVLFGEVEAERNGHLNSSVSSGITIEERRRFGRPRVVSWLPQGKLASEAVISLLRR